MVTGRRVSPALRIEDPDAKKDGLMDFERPRLFPNITDRIDDIDEDPFTPSKPKRAQARKGDARPRSVLSPGSIPASPSLGRSGPMGALPLVSSDANPSVTRLWRCA